MLSAQHEVFLEVAKQKSFSKAAEEMYISQPAISKHIKQLEFQYKTKLFDRRGMYIELTPAGELLFERLTEVKRIQEQTLFDITTLSKAMEAEGVLKLGASTTVALYILPKVLSIFHEQHPNLTISLLNRNTEIVLDALLNKEINLGIIEEKGQLTNVSYLPFITDEVVAVCSRQSIWAQKKNYQVKDLYQMPLAIRERGSGTLAVLKKNLEKHKIQLNDLNIKVRLGGTEALKNFLIESDCLGFLPHRSVIKELKYGELKQLHFEGLSIVRNFYFIQRKGETSNLNKLLIKTAQSVYHK
ncbi:MAG: LysR family transcriptional regulator [Hydrotalea flava]|uniref:LysR family transcriptional regulator n=1 Tax=Hydrotalea TaxID=1004300 RepID=UPI000945AC04|nr:MULTISPECIES: LysR family transcriptional regulator [Hydrotalea]NIM35320.1 LysR family transcriptional regulator [Hydrotalea flava]NIM38179.1 LysR family transcriptional regulator [Hydrotalea flava]NIN03343.1 LysR family transcriptional regulator [Hydrotalea flava]NIN15037.1 LysR family transcriptional regulator [Hydrotalea flava]NIO94105.1 LysR family transcriptional regulator [Hydrotalea flava]